MAQGTQTKDFHIGDVLSITTGYLVSLEHIGGVYKILNWMTGEDLMTHQLPRASRECEDFLRSQHPELSAVDVPKIGSLEECETFLSSLYPRFGEQVPVAPLPSEDHTSIDPLTELKMMNPDAKVVVVQMGDDE